jgi:predicted metal-binding protein
MDSLDLEEEFSKFLQQHNRNFSKKLLLYDGTCRYCKIQNKGSCTYDSGNPCRFPIEKRYSMESVGIDVISTVRELKQKEVIDIEYPSNKYSYRFGLACFK